MSEPLHVAGATVRKVGSLHPPDSLARDRRFCRHILPRVSRTFAINIRLLTGTLGEAVRIGYLLCRAADTIEDAWPAGEAETGFACFLDAVAGDGMAADSLARTAALAPVPGPELELVARLPAVLRAHAALPAACRAAVTDGVTTLASGMSSYAARAAARPPGAPYLDTEEDLEHYCWVVAGCVGVMLTRLYAEEHGPGEPSLQARRLELAPRVGEALQLTNILLDWPADLRRGRCHLPADWLREHGLAPADLVDRATPAVAQLAARLEAKARRALARVPDYVELIPRRHRRYRLFCLWPALWAAGSLRHARRDPQFPWGPRRPKLPRAELLRSALGSLIDARAGDALRRLAPLSA